MLKKVKCDERTDGWTDRPIKRGIELRSTRLKIYIYFCNKHYSDQF